MLAFLLMMGLVQCCASKSDFEDGYDVSASLTQAEPVLIENLHAMDMFKRQMAQRKRRAATRNSNE